ncbi:hypothetical protein VPHD249_0167 [Vibrio phage D249]|nr:hypothetical protein SIPHO036v1_50002 [Vibrio phage 70E38.1]QZI88058.1 hypothetical protein SIPHO041v1_p0147 [Vibrio phage 234P1]QZI88232.1 hypothetical protein SIPHO035v1_p0141 [Vibrio phage 234P7B]QZI88302.1 hypothetical protein SIPHO082v1_p0025 [Vibrio phage 294E48.1]QZI88598.1 hypothetical protein SIPHO037v1_p0157 [Vibrio phage 70E35.2]QZI89055.1 hypothetical protein SIPHO042v1_p0058 [Vibrio phage 70E37.1]QZI89231.1 hypothetical protein SIPHO038v1_p0053 [Vibrio phage 70E37.6]
MIMKLLFIGVLMLCIVGKIPTEALDIMTEQVPGMVVFLSFAICTALNYLIDIITKFILEQ